MLQQQIIFEDKDLLAINKPNGLVVNVSDTTPDGTLQQLISDKISVFGDDTEFARRGGIVHRLDKETSGIVVVAKNIDSFEHLKSQFKQRKVEKHYYGVVIGQIKDSLVEINAPLKRNPRNRMRFAVVEGGRESLTSARKLKDVDGYTLMDIVPKTGRTHQIRVHFAAMGFPIAGDYLYCSHTQFQASMQKFGRMMLHAYFLSFVHPRTKSPMVLNCFPEGNPWQIFMPLE